ncbi:MAG: hypothetical protein CM15mP47_1670 [Methanobacteriota archaeon]|nr:MAG: hypothetical protein CM15mP47_1670 [Euryarchaeota archaeon]
MNRLWVLNFYRFSWTSDIDGRLSSTNQEGLYYTSRLSSGLHNLTLEIDDGINPPVTDTTTVEISKSAPVLSLATPDTSITYSSSEYIFWNAIESVDYDGDDFTMSIFSNLQTEAILLDVDPGQTHISQLQAGDHEIMIQLTDSDGMQRIEIIDLVVIPSPPNAIIVNPAEGQSFLGGEEIIIEEESIDADFDIVFRQWEVIDKSSGTVVHTSSSSTEQLSLTPGEYLVILTVRDSLQSIETDTRNIRVENTNPMLDPQSLIVTPSEFTAGVLVTVDVSVELSDPDGTTQDVRGTIVYGLQVWNFVLQDLDGDNIWEGSIEINPEEAGRPSLRIVATDGVGDSATISQVSRTIVVNEAEQSSTNLSLIIGGTSVALLMIISGVILAKVRRSRFEDELIESWDTLKQPRTTKEHPELGAESVDGTQEVVNDLWSQLEQEEGLN